MVTSPPNAVGGMSVRIVPPRTKPQRRIPQNKGQLFEVKVPDNVGPGNPSVLVANGIRISVKCPHDALPGKKLNFMYSQSRNVSIHCLHHIRTL